MEQPPGFIDSSRPGYVCHLTKALYGLKQAPRAWFQRLHSFLVSEGFQSSASDSSLFICRGSNSLLVVLVYVDDLVITGSHTELVSALIDSICTKFASRDLGPIGFFLDADWAGDPTTRRSISGTCVLFGGNIVSWSAKKQPTVARSSAESEYRSLANATADMSWFCSLLRELGMVIPSPPLILCDNQSAIQMSRNTTSTSRSRHIDIDYHFIRDLVARGALSVTYVPSSDQLADVFTKPLSKDRLREISNKPGVCPLRLP
ncbi:hypothetical protein KSP39_PZI009121 [Platanthera zijinensis]|uniref:Reverse transcriptase Ty1/copia-type domain-containing protein n=1 Tax=Platanthera zijinensis TaxID=2320716 RepID=A0AAP0G897_9ASPA